MTSSAPTTAAAVANEFLDLQAIDPGYPPIDPMKLQKLVFYAHAWYLGLKDTPLYEDDVFAWPWGPVVPSIYSEFRDFGRKPIVGRKATTVRKTGPGHLDFRLVVPSVEDEEAKAFLKQIWDVHQKFTGVQLSNATHNPGEPWTVVKERYATLDSKPLIPNDLIASIFSAKAGREEAANA
jgi:uncharacterized phage-associated protein